jgi:hypothetical protein
LVADLIWSGVQPTAAFLKPQRGIRHWWDGPKPGWSSGGRLWPHTVVTWPTRFGKAGQPSTWTMTPATGTWPWSLGHRVWICFPAGQYGRVPCLFQMRSGCPAWQLSVLKLWKQRHASAFPFKFKQTGLAAAFTIHSQWGTNRLVSQAKHIFFSVTLTQNGDLACVTGSNLLFNKQCKRCVLGQGGLIWYKRIEELHNGLSLLLWRKIHVHGLCFPKVPSTEKELREKWCFPAHLNSHGHVKGKGVNHLGHIYIYLHGGGGDDDAWTASKE